MSATKVSGSTPVVGSDVGRVSTATGRATPKGPGFGTVLAKTRPILKGAEAVATVLPGGPLIAAAIKAPTAMSGPAYGGPSYAGAKPGGAAMAPRIPLGGASAGLAPGGAPDPTAAASGEAPPIEGMLADSQQFNLYFLQLQEQISAENRQYTALSNVLKARHDTVKNAIGNIR